MLPLVCALLSRCALIGGPAVATPLFQELSERATAEHAQDCADGEIDFPLADQFAAQRVFVDADFDTHSVGVASADPDASSLSGASRIHTHTSRLNHFA